MRIRNWIPGTVVCAVLLTVGPHATAVESVVSGLERPHVEVDYLAPQVVEAGFDEESVVRDVSLALSRAGFVVLASSESQTAEGPAVAVSFDVVETPNSDLVYQATLELREDVELIREAGTVVSGSTWCATTLGVVPYGDLETVVPATLTSLLDRFLLDAGMTTP